MVKSPPSSARGCGFNPWSSTMIPQAAGVLQVHQLTQVFLGTRPATTASISHLHWLCFPPCCFPPGPVWFVPILNTCTWGTDGFLQSKSKLQSEGPCSRGDVGPQPPSSNLPDRTTFLSEPNGHPFFGRSPCPRTCR